MQTAPYQIEPDDMPFAGRVVAANHSALDEVEAKLKTLTTWDAIAEFHDDGIFEIMDSHGADYRDCEEFNEVYSKVKAKLDALDGVAA